MPPKTPKYWECVQAESPFYIRGKIYELVQNDSGAYGFIASDGLFDRKSQVVSKFKPSTEEEFKGQLKAVS
jgi:hypothetical protein